MTNFTFTCTNLRVPPAEVFERIFDGFKEEKFFPASTYYHFERKGITDEVFRNHSEKTSFIAELRKVTETSELFVIALGGPETEIILPITKNFEILENDPFGFGNAETPENLRVRLEPSGESVKKVTALPPFARGYLEGECNSLSQFILKLRRQPIGSRKEVSASFCREVAYKIASVFDPDFIIIEPFSGRSLNAYVEENGIERLYTGSSFFFYWRGELRCSPCEGQWIHGKYLEHFKKHPTLWNECLAELRAIEGSFVEEFLNGIYIDVGISELRIGNKEAFFRVGGRAEKVGEILKKYHKQAYALSKA